MALTLGRVVGAATRSRTMRLHEAWLLAGAATTAMALLVAGAAVEAARDGVPGFRDAALAVGALVFAGWAVRIVSGRGLRFPQPGWQVPEQWRYELPHGFAMGAYGYLLGLGVTTNPILPAVWVTCLLSLWSANALAVLAAWLGYAAVRIVTTRRATRRAVEQARALPATDPDIPLNTSSILTGVRVLNVALLVGLTGAALGAVAT